jgi:hypothetical protein
MAFREWLGNLRAAPIATEFLLNIVGQEVRKRLPFIGEVDCIAHRDHLLVVRLK